MSSAVSTVHESRQNTKMETGIPSTRRSEFWDGVRTTIPLMIGAIPFAIIYGATAMAVGLSVAGTIGMSGLVFAGSAQFVAVELLGKGAGVAVVVFTTLIVNLRHTLYSVSLAPHMRHLPQRWLAPLAFTLTDETYVTVIRRYAQPDNSPHKVWFHFGSAAALYVTWMSSTIIGVWVGSAIADPQRWGLDFALVATFIGMLVPMLHERPVLVAALAAGVSSVIFYGLPHGMGLLVAALIGVVTGVMAEHLGSNQVTQTEGAHE